MDREKVVKDNAVRGLQSAIEISGAMVHLRKEHAKALLVLLKEHKEKMEHLNNITLEYEKEVFRLRALLKEHEAKPVKVVKNAYNHEFYHCPRCDHPFYRPWVKPKFCYRCGQEVNWNECFE